MNDRHSAYYRPQTKFANVMFLQVSVCPRGGVPGKGACMAGMFVHSGGACMGRRVVCGRGTCMVGGVHGRGHTWHGEGGVCMAGGVHGGGGMHDRGTCMVGSMHGRGACVIGGMHGRGGVCGRRHA